MEENTNSTVGPVFNKNNNWLWILVAVAVIAILVYFIFTNLSLFNLPAAVENTQNIEQNNSQPVANNNTGTEENADSLLNQLDAAEGAVTQALSDTPIDVMSDE